MTGFKNFILRGNLVELAVAFVMAAAFATVVTATVGLLMDLIGKVGGSPDFSNYAPGGISVGVWITAVISFLILAAVVYFADRQALHRGQGALLPEPRARHPRGHQAPPGDPRPAVRAAGRSRGDRHAPDRLSRLAASRRGAAAPAP